jgi:hypothetical protein
VKVLQKPLVQSASTSQGVQMPEGGPLCTCPVLPELDDALELELLLVLPCVPELDPWVPMVLWPVEPDDVLAALDDDDAVPEPVVVPASPLLQPRPSAAARPHTHRFAMGVDLAEALRAVTGQRRPWARRWQATPGSRPRSPPS